MILGLLLPAAALTSGDPAVATSRYVQVEMITSTLAPKPGSTFTIGLRMTPRPGWHGYWNNPGGSGLAPTARWAGPSSLSFGPLQHPAPTLMRSMGLLSFVHEGPHTLVTRISVGKQIARGTPIPISGKLDFALCSATECVPEHAALSMVLTAGDGAPGPGASEVAVAASKLPRNAPNGTFFPRKNEIALQPPTALKLDARTLRFFPDVNGFLDAGSGKPDRLGGSAITVATTGKIPKRISGVLSDGNAAYRISFDQETEPKSGPSNLAEKQKHAPTVSASPAHRAGNNSAGSDQIQSPDVDLGFIRKILLAAAIAAFGSFAFLLARRRYR